MTTNSKARKLEYTDDCMTIAANGFVMVNGTPLGTLNQDGTIALHVRNGRRCVKCKPPIVDLAALVSLAGEFGVMR